MLPMIMNLLRMQMNASNMSNTHSGILFALAKITTLPSVKSSEFFKQRYDFRRMASFHSAEILHNKALATLERLSRRDLPRNQSKRTPATESCNDLADILEKALQETGLRAWGFPIDRCVYESDADWAKSFHRYQWHVSDRLERYNGLDVLGSFQTTVLGDRSLFEDASTAQIREHFQRKATSAIRESGD